MIQKSGEKRKTYQDIIFSLPMKADTSLNRTYELMRWTSLYVFPSSFINSNNARGNAYDLLGEIHIFPFLSDFLFALADVDAAHRIQ